MPKDLTIQLVGRDKLSISAKNMLQLQSKFSNAGISDEVDIAYYYANGSVGHKWGVFGNGIYTANNPVCFSQNGEVGFLVALLKGQSANCFKAASKRGKKIVWPRPDSNTIIGNRRKGTMTRNRPSSENDFFDEIVLQESAQCLPLVQFNGPFINCHDPSFIGHELVFMCHLEMLAMLDLFFNDGTKAEVKRDKIFPPSHLFPYSEEKKDTLKSPTILYTEARLGPTEMKKMKTAVQLKSNNPLLSNQESLVKAGFTFAESRDPFKQEHIIRAMKLRSPQKSLSAQSSTFVELLPRKESSDKRETENSHGKMQCVARFKEVVRQRINMIRLSPRKKTQRRRRSSLSAQRRRSSTGSESRRSSLSSQNSYQEDPELHSGTFC